MGVVGSRAATIITSRRVPRRHRPDTPGYYNRRARRPATSPQNPCACPAVRV